MPPDLIAALDNSQGGIDRWIAILWTWLEPQLQALESREEKLHDIRYRACKELVSRPDLDVYLSRLRESSDLLADAAFYLARIERWVLRSGREITIASRWVEGVDGVSYFIAPRSPWVSQIYWGPKDKRGDHPPAADYPPSMAILVPSLVLVPQEVRGVELGDVGVVVDADAASAKALARAQMRFEAITAWYEAERNELSAQFVVHLATLGPNSTEGFRPVNGRNVFVYEDPPREGVYDQQVNAALAAAVSVAAKAEASILVIPEFALPVHRLDTLQDLLAAADPAPVLTVAGLRHRAVDGAGEPTHDREGAPLSRWVNEAVVLGDDGTELFRHRKLTAFHFYYEGRLLEEDTRVGTCLRILRTPVGNITVMICMDAFGGTDDRLRQSHASIVLVPSLSKSVSPHSADLANSVRWLWGSAYVCNRDPFASDEAAWLADKVRSFWTVAALNRGEPARQAVDGIPTFEFRLGQDLAT